MSKENLNNNNNQEPSTGGSQAGVSSFFAVDLGATSGRTIIGRLANGKIELEELTRFDNNLIETGGHVY